MLPTTESSPPLVPETLDISFSEDLLSSLVRNFADYGDAFRAHSPVTQRDIYVFSHPAHVKHVLVSRHQNYTKGLGIERVGILLGKGIMVSEGHLWRQQRKLIQPGFHPDTVAGMTRHIVTANLELREKWLDCAGRGEAINLTQDMSEVTLQVVLRAIFSSDLDDMISAQGGNPFSLLTDDTERSLSFAVKFRALSKLILEYVNRRRTRSRKHDDLLSMLIAACDRKTGEPMPDRQLLDEVMTLIVAGHETSASALNWMWYLLSQHPAQAQRLQREIDALPNHPDDASMIQDLTYTRQVIEETLRLYPPGWLLTRRTIAEDSIDGYTLPASADVFISPYIVHRHPKFWDDPQRFDPERFAPAQAAERNRFAYLPFALGPRACIGEHFAMVEMLLHAAILARDVELSYIDEGPIELECQVNLRSRRPIMMIPRQRSRR